MRQINLVEGKVVAPEGMKVGDVYKRQDQNYRVDVRHAIIICTSNYKSKDEIKEKLGDPIFNRFDGVIKDVYKRQLQCRMSFEV